MAEQLRAEIAQELFAGIGREPLAGEIAKLGRHGDADQQQHRKQEHRLGRLLQRFRQPRIEKAWEWM